MALPLAADEDVDELLREVAVPPDLLEWLQAAALADDDGLDQALRDVPGPGRPGCFLPPTCPQSFCRRAARAAAISRFAMAASLIVAVTVSLGCAMLLSLILNGPLNWQFVTVPPPTPVAPRRLKSLWKPLGGCWPTSLLSQYKSLRSVMVSVQSNWLRWNRQRRWHPANLMESGRMPAGSDPWAMRRDGSPGVLGRQLGWDADPSLPSACPIWFRTDSIGR